MQPVSRPTHMLLYKCFACIGLQNIAKPAERVCTYFGQMCARTFRATIQASNDHRCRNSDKKKFIKIYSVNQMIKILWKNTCAQTLLYKLQMTPFLQKNTQKKWKTVVPRTLPYKLQMNWFCQKMQYVFKRYYASFKRHANFKNLWKKDIPKTLLYMIQMNIWILLRPIWNQKLYSKCNYKDSSKWLVRPNVTIQASKRLKNFTKIKKNSGSRNITI